MRVDDLAVHPHDGVGAIDVEHLALGLAAEHDRPDAGRAAGHEHGARRAVAEQHGGLAVVGVGVAREDVGADQQDDVGAAALDQRGALLQAGEKARAGKADVPGHGASAAERAGDQRRGVGHDVVGRGGRDEHGVDVGGSTPAAASARAPASMASSVRPSPSATRRREVMPVRFVIHAGSTPMRAAIGALSTTVAGSARPKPAIPAVRRRGSAGGASGMARGA